MTPDSDAETGLHTEVEQPRRLKRGIYETTYGNAAYVSGPKATTAYDLDMAECIPISEVTDKWLRKAEPYDSPSYRTLD